MMTFKLLLLYLVYWICFPLVFVIEVIGKSMKKRDWYNRAWLACDLVFFTRPALFRRSVMAGSALETKYWTSNYFLNANNCFGMHRTKELATWLVKRYSAQNGYLDGDGGRIAKYFNPVQSFFDMYLWMRYRSKGLCDSSPSLCFQELMDAQNNKNISDNDYAMRYGACLTMFKYNASDQYKDTLVLFFITLKTMHQYCIVLIVTSSVILTGLEIVLLINLFKKKSNGKKEN